MDEPLDALFNEWSPATRMPDALEGWMEVIRADPLPKDGGTVLICYSSHLGNVGLLVKDRISLPGIEHAAVNLAESARVKLVEAPEPMGSRHKLRALIVLHEDDAYTLRRSLISLGVGAPE
jgi:hypothetical protein